MSFVYTPVTSRDKWDEFLHSHAPNALFQSWLWGDVQKASGETIWRMGIMNREEMVGIAQIVVVRAKRGTFLHVRHGPVLKNQNVLKWREFIDLTIPLARKERAWFIRVSPLLDNSDVTSRMFSSLGFLPAAIHEVDAERCWVLDIDKKDDELLMGCRKTTRYEIRLAQKMDVEIRKSEAVADIKYFNELYKETSKRHGFVGHSSIEEEFAVFSREHRAMLINGFWEGKICASALILFYGGQAIYHHGASISSKAPVSYLVQWEAILEAKKRGIKLYNFYGIAPDDMPNHPWRGITLFKKGFGGREISYIHAHDYPLSHLYMIPRSIELIRRRLKGYA